MKWLVLLLLIISIGFSAAFSFLTTRSQKHSLSSPLPTYLDRAYTFGVSTLNIWLPEAKSPAVPNTPQISAKSALIYELTTERVLYTKNLQEKLPVASLIKIMTAIVALENMSLSDVYTVSKTAAEIGEDSMGLTAGERLTLEELLYGLMLVSGNDAAEVIVENFPAHSTSSGLGGRDAFVRAMNDKARSLGLKDSFFINPTGLEEDHEKQYSTAYDLLVMTKYALTLPKFAEIVGTYEHVIPYTKDHKALFLYNDTNLLTSYPGVRGVKPGYTPEAGLCLVTYAENGGEKIIGVVLGSESRREEMRTLLDYSFNILGVKLDRRN